MIYQNCGPLCPQTCDNELSSELCISGCVEGCFCLDGQIVVDGECAHPVSCPGMYACTYVHYIHAYVHTTNAYSIHIYICIRVNVPSHFFKFYEILAIYVDYLYATCVFTGEGFLIDY